MKRPATWKVLTVGAAMTGLGVLGTGAAMADDTGATTSGPWLPPNICCDVPVTATDDGDASQSESRVPLGWYFIR